MPRGTPNPKTDSDGKGRKILLTLTEADYLALQRLAADQYRTPTLQAAYLLARVLREAGLSPAGHAERIIEKARKVNGESHQ